jgi:hypothetical protein
MGPAHPPAPSLPPRRPRSVQGHCLLVSDEGHSCGRGAWLSIPKRVSGCYVLCRAKWNYSLHLRGLVTDPSVWLESW